MRAAKVAAAEGVCIEWKDGVWRITPASAVSPLATSEQEAAECDKAFGVAR
jgi:hypothetical protein